jgi:CheY-like chemotaxis protein
MITGENGQFGILVIDDIDEISDGLQFLLESDGYRVEAARSEKYAIESAIRNPPQLILVNLAGSLEEVIAAARRIGQKASLKGRVPVVLFCVEGIEGSEVHLGGTLKLLHFGVAKIRRNAGDPGIAQQATSALDGDVSTASSKLVRFLATARLWT